ncbi:hypothetical protein CDD83_5427 [Cordyceps sp. RAO-2017]|nr:hypothetical protein CDD83_5427 [Cordyceps sp. RAO-2017]
MAAQADKKLIEEYRAQVRELQQKLESAEDAMKKKDDEMSDVLDGERSRATAANLEKKEWADLRLNLEDKLAEARSLNQSMEEELDRMRDEHDAETRRLRDELAALQQTSRGARPGNANPDAQRENDQLREDLRQQQQVTDEVRREAQEFLREMRALSQQSDATYEKQAEMEKTIEQLEREVRDWRNRYARTKTQLRSMRASSLGLERDHDAAKYVRDKGFLDGNGLVKDVLVVKFQTAIDELLQTARQDTPEKVIDAMKLVVVSVRRITRDLDEAAANDDEAAHQQSRLKAKVSSTANSLITASKNFASSAGISPVSLLDAAASHLTAAIVDLLRAVKIRTTPAAELEDEEEGTMTPVDSTGFFSPRSTTQASTQENLPPPPPFQGIGGMRASAESSAYSPVSSPRASVEPYPGSGANGLSNGLGYMGLNKGLAAAGYGMQRGGRPDDFKIYLGDQTALLVSAVQSLVNCVRGDADVWQITDDVEAISATVGRIMSEADANSYDDEAARLDGQRKRLVQATQRGRQLLDSGVGQGDRDWRAWAQSLPPMAFEIVREVRELAQRPGRRLSAGSGDDEFS